MAVKPKLTAERLMPTETGIRYYEHLKRYIFASGYVKEKRVLDAACGYGYGSYMLLKQGGAKKVVGIDIAKEAIDYAKENYCDSLISFLKMDATKLEFPNGSFDVVVTFEALEHIPDYAKFLSEIGRVLTKGGTLIISTPNKKTFGCDLKTPFVKYHVKEFYLKEFAMALRDAGFDIKKIYNESPSKKFRWIYDLRKLVVTFPFIGRLISKYYQELLSRSEKKFDDSIVLALLNVVGLKFSIEDIYFTDKNLDKAIYFIAICKKD